MGDYNEHEHEHDHDHAHTESEAVVNETTGDFAESLNEYEGPTAAEAAEVFVEAEKRGFQLPDLSTLDLRKLDWSAIRRGDFETIKALELPKVEIPKVEIPKISKADLDPRNLDFDKVKHDASSLANTAVAKAGEVASDVRKNVESGVKLAREAVGL
jgi:hypothetical protein